MPMPNPGSHRANVVHEERPPILAEADVETVKFAVTGPVAGVTLFWSKLHVIPAGTLGQERATADLNPFTGVTVTV